jgi:hypothetical protein
VIGETCGIHGGEEKSVRGLMKGNDCYVDVGVDGTITLN